MTDRLPAMTAGRCCGCRPAGTARGSTRRVCPRWPAGTWNTVPRGISSTSSEPWAPKSDASRTSSARRIQNASAWVSGSPRPRFGKRAGQVGHEVDTLGRKWPRYWRGPESVENRVERSGARFRYELFDGGQLGRHSSARPVVGMSVGAAAQFRARHAAEDPQLLARPSRGGCPEALHNAEVLGEQYVPGVGPR